MSIADNPVFQDAEAAREFLLLESLLWPDGHSCRGPGDRLLPTIGDANRNSVRAGIAFESYFGLGNAPLKARCRLQRKVWINPNSSRRHVSNHRMRPNRPPSRVGTKWDGRCGRPRTSSATKRFGHSPTGRFW
jgi:hypothetical protein